ncbi:MAG: YjbQ family protein [Actinomycetota bacterium]|nr:YjbQ family protein [Actinomycetota bacterium]
MQSHRCECTVTTPGALEFVDVTDDVTEALATSHVLGGHVTVTAPPGCSIIVNEFESGLLSDLKRTMLDLQGQANGSRPKIGSGSVVLPAVDGRLRLGRWQRLLLIELEQPSRRSVGVQVVGE